MTEQEAEVLAARLTRIWHLESLTPDEWQRRIETSHFSFNLAERWPPGSENPVVFIWEQGDISLHAIDCSLEFFQNRVVLSVNENYPAEVESAHKFAAQYLSFFRRGCWLSGCNIEATAHEKIEWMQGFSREELQAWNLKM